MSPDYEKRTEKKVSLSHVLKYIAAEIHGNVNSRHGHFYSVHVHGLVDGYKQQRFTTTYNELSHNLVIEI